MDVGYGYNGQGNYTGNYNHALGVVWWQIVG